jgi:hypothetical protein
VAHETGTAPLTEEPISGPIILWHSIQTAPPLLHPTLHNWRDVVRLLSRNV